MAQIEIKKLKKFFGRVKAVNGASFEVEKGEIFGFLGPNGAGKTTTIRCLLDFIRPTAGEIVVLGKKISDSDYHLIRQSIGYLIPSSSLNGNWTVRDHIDFKNALSQTPDDPEMLLRRFRLDDSIKVKNLSSGNKQKLSLILALMNNPQLLILDEPTLGLDPLLQVEFYKILKERSFKGVSTLISSHNLSEVEKICTRVAMIKAGKIINVQKVSELEGKKIHSVRIVFKGEVAKNQIVDNDIQVEEEIAGGYVLTVKGKIDKFIKKISRFEVVNLTIAQATLDEIFMEYYK